MMVSDDAFYTIHAILMASAIIGISLSAVAYATLMASPDDATKARGGSLSVWVVALLFLGVTSCDKVNEFKRQPPVVQGS